MRIHLAITLLLLSTTPIFPQQTMGGVSTSGGVGTRGFAGGGATCIFPTGITAQFRAIDLTPGTVTNFPDATGHGYDATAVGGPVAGTSDPTPAGTQTLVLSGSQYGRMTTNAIPSMTAASIFVVFKPATGTNKNTFDSASAGTNAPGYFGGSPSNVEGVDSTFVANLISGTNTTASWHFQGFTGSSTGGTYTLYRDSSTDGTATGQSTGINGPIDRIFTNWNNTPSEQVAGTFAELAIWSRLLSPTEVGNLHVCYQIQYGIV